jgi:hypothetical protein
VAIIDAPNPADNVAETAFSVVGRDPCRAH